MTTTKKIAGMFLARGLLTMSLVATAAVGCSEDPNGGTAATGGKGGGSSAGATGGAGGSVTVSLGPIVGTVLQGFDTQSGAAAFMLSDYEPAAPIVNLAGKSAATKAMTTLSWDATEGSPTPGCLKISAPFTDWDQWVEVDAVTQMPLLDWSSASGTGKRLHVRLKVGSGFGQDPYALSGAQALVDSGSSYTQINSFKTVALGGQWQEFTLDLPPMASGGFDPSMVITFGIQMTTGSGNTTAGTLKPTPGVLYVDSFSIE